VGDSTIEPSVGAEQNTSSRVEAMERPSTGQNIVSSVASSIDTCGEDRVVTALPNRTVAFALGLQEMSTSPMLYALYHGQEGVRDGKNFILRVAAKNENGRRKDDRMLSRENSTTKDTVKIQAKIYQKRNLINDADSFAKIYSE
jgi:hypothetical protein